MQPSGPGPNVRRGRFRLAGSLVALLSAASCALLPGGPKPAGQTNVAGTGASPTPASSASGVEATTAPSTSPASSASPDGGSVAGPTSVSNPAAPATSSTSVVSTLAGYTPPLLWPMAVAMDGSGNVFVADQGNNRIRKIASDGTISTFAGSGAVGKADGVGTAASFWAPGGLAADAAGNVYVADRGNQVIRKITPDGTVSTLAGSGAKGAADGSGTAATFQFTEPEWGARSVPMCMDAQGNILVAHASSYPKGDALRKVTPGGVVTTLMQLSSFADTLEALAKGSDGTIYAIAGVTFGRIVEFDAAFAPILVASDSLALDGDAGLAVDSAGNFYTSSGYNNWILKITPEGSKSYLAGAFGGGFADGTGGAAEFNDISRMIADGADNLYVTELGNHSVRKVTPGGVVTTLAGGTAAGFVDGPAATARFKSPEDVAADSAGNLYVADLLNGAIRKIAPDGSVSTLGTGGASSGLSPDALTVDGSGNVYVLDAKISGSDVKKVTPAGTVTAVASSTYSRKIVGESRSTGSGGGIALDPAGNIYVAGDDLIQKITPEGTVTTFAGTTSASVPADGTGTAAVFGNLHAIVGDGGGNFYVLDRSSVRKVSAAGVVTTIFTRPQSASYASFDSGALAMDRSGNLFITTGRNSSRGQVFEITAAGSLQVLAGTGRAGALDGPGSAATFGDLLGIAVGPTGTVFVVDNTAKNIRKIQP